ncbi:MAG: hypothetical protein NVSMB17_10380 [Candidatus Dormibacteria bacterium]
MTSLSRIIKGPTDAYWSTSDMSTEAFSAYLKDRCRDRGLSLHRLAVQADLNQIYFYQSVNKNKENPPPWVLRRVAPLLQVPYVELLMRAGYLSDAELADFTGERPQG